MKKLIWFAVAALVLALTIGCAAASAETCTCSGAACMEGSYDDRCPVCLKDPSLCAARLAAKAPTTAKPGLIDLANGGVDIYADHYEYNGQSVSYRGAYTVTGAGRHVSVCVTSGVTASITLSDANVVNGAGNFLRVMEGAQANVTLKGKSILSNWVGENPNPYNIDASAILCVETNASLAVRGSGTLLMYDRSTNGVSNGPVHLSGGTLAFYGGSVRAVAPKAQSIVLDYNIQAAA